MIFFCSCVLFSASSLVTRSSHIYQKKSSPIARISERLTWVRTHWWCCRTTHSSTWRSQTSTWATIIWGARFSRKTPFVHFPFQVNTFFEQHLSILGNNIATLNNKELVVDLSNNNMRFMLESEWRPYIETRKSTGHCVMQVPETLLLCSLPLDITRGTRWAAAVTWDGSSPSTTSGLHCSGERTVRTGGSWLRWSPSSWTVCVPHLHVLATIPSSTHSHLRVSFKT